MSFYRSHRKGEFTQLRTLQTTYGTGCPVFVQLELNYSSKHVYVAEMPEMTSHNHDVDGALLPFYAENRKLGSTECGEVQYLLADHPPVHTVAAFLNVDRTGKGHVWLRKTKGCAQHCSKVSQRWPTKYL